MELRTIKSVVLLLLLLSVLGCRSGGDDQGMGGGGGALGGEAGSGEGGVGGEAHGEGGGGGGGSDDTRIARLELNFADFCPLHPACAMIRVGWTRTLIATATDHLGERIEDAEIDWESTDTQVVTVDGEGLVTAVGVGSARVVATSEDVEASQFFVVSKAAVAKVFVAPETLSLPVGATGHFEATAYGHDAIGELTGEIPDAEINWVVTNPLVAEIIGPGEVRVKGGGATWVMAESPDGIPAHEGHALIVSTSEDLLPNGMALESISIGPTHGCGLAPDGRIHCWGRNDEGQLGLGRQDEPRDSFPTPAPILADPALRFSALDSNGGNCGLDQEGKAWCWGNNMLGQLGLGEDVPGSAIALPMADDHVFTRITLGLGFGCGIDAEQIAWCWGTNASGEVGMGVVGRDRIGQPDWEEHWVFWNPVAVIGDHRFVQIEAGNWTTCALDDVGQAWCWGENEVGTLGNGDVTVRVVGEPTPVAGGLRFTSISMGYTHGCGLTGDGEAWCWGRNYSGQLGAPSGYGPYALEPVSFEPLRVGGGRRFTSIVTGGFHTCALDEESAAWCWGNNEYGQTGTGIHSESIELPTLVYGDLRFRQLFSGSHQTCGITLEGHGVCWGDNLFGVLGLGFSGVIGQGTSHGLSPIPWPIAEPR